jgi:hypothetical protein
MPERRLIYRTRGRRHGPITRLMSPSDLGELLRPFVFLDHFDTAGGSTGGFGLHPHSGIATVTWILEGNVSYEDTTGETGKIPTGGLEWMQAGGGVWHGGGFGDSPRIRGFQLWVALPPSLELGPAQSLYLKPDQIQRDGPVACSWAATEAPAARSQRPRRSTTCRCRSRRASVGRISRPSSTRSHGLRSAGEAFVRRSRCKPASWRSSRSRTSHRLHAETDVELVVGSAVKHPHELVLGHYSVHTSADALRAGEARIQQIANRLRAKVD